MTVVWSVFDGIKYNGTIAVNDGNFYHGGGRGVVSDFNL